MLEQISISSERRQEQEAIVNIKVLKKLIQQDPGQFIRETLWPVIEKISSEDNDELGELKKILQPLSNRRANVLKSININSNHKGVSVLLQIQSDANLTIDDKDGYVSDILLKGSLAKKFIQELQKEVEK